ncbi:hypothetical protein B0J18DRAFT_407134 [Chaetomium sp. MPI-SDFR-AT-0129]|nr:hypothetical protein B0J18DRAFT_407134 [Chaetomium sp. MPI-SDFR-AT-0129]
MEYTPSLRASSGREMENPSALSAFPVLTDPASSDYCIEPPADPSHSQVIRKFSTVEEIVLCIIHTRQDAFDRKFPGQLILGFQWQATEVAELLEQLDAVLIELGKSKIHRFEYDFKSETLYLSIMGESRFHYQVLAGTRRHIEYHLAKLDARAKTDDSGIRSLVRSIYEYGTADIEYEGKIFTQADVSFAQPGTLPSLVCEVSKLHNYIDSSDGKIRAALIIDLQYPGMNEGRVSLLTAGDPSSTWVHHSDLFFDDNLGDQQPAGQVALYLSDFVGLAPDVPPAFCRPSSAEVAAGITRTPTIAVTYERLRAIFRRARHLHSPTRFTVEASDKEENLYEEGREEGHEEGREEGHEEGREEGHEECRKEERVKTERLIAEMKQRIAESEQGRADAERRLAEAYKPDEERNKTRIEM